MSAADFQRRLMATFKAEAKEHVEALSAHLIDLERTTSAEHRQPIVEAVFRRAHTLKGAAHSVNAREVESICADLEHTFAAMKRGELDPDVHLLDRLHVQTNELRSLLGVEVTPPSSPDSLPAVAGPAPTPDPAVPVAAAPAPPEAAPDNVQLPDTVRVATSKLDSVLFQAEEMLFAKLSAVQRETDLSQIQARLAEWTRHWTRVRAQVRAMQRLVGSDTGGTDSVHSILAFLDWTAALVQQMQQQAGAAERAASSDARALGTMVEKLLASTKEALMLPFASLVDLLPRLARDVAREQGKHVDVQVQGAAVEIDRRILEALKDPFIHLIRNAVDHGIELPDDREAAAKDPRGRINIAVTQLASGNIEIVIADDGGGIDPAKLREVAAESGIRPAADISRLTDTEALQLIFESGFSTAPELTQISGRGLGLAIVRETVERLGGSIAAETVRGKGTAFRITVPNSMARFRGVLVTVAQSEFILPTAAINRVLRIGPEAMRLVQGRQTFRLGEETLLVSGLHEVLALRGRRPPAAASTPAVVIGGRDRRAIFTVDEVHGEEEVLMKSLGKQLRRVPGLLGATVMADGRVIPVLNAGDLLTLALRPTLRAAPVAAPAKSARKSILVAEDSITSRTLLKNILQGAGYNVETAVNGADAFARLKSRQFNLLVSDVDMPQMGGLDLTAKVRSDADLSSLPVILVTSLASRADRERGIDVGANAYIVKSSFDQSDLLEAAVRLTGGK